MVNDIGSTIGQVATYKVTTINSINRWRYESVCSNVSGGYVKITLC